jgi:hypothetical protein
MKTRLFLPVAICFLAAGSLEGRAQTPPGPPNVLSIFREQVKPGRGAAHVKVEAGYVAAFRKAKGHPYLAMTTITGPDEAWFVVAYQSFEDYENDTRSIEKNAALTAELEQLDERDSSLRTGQTAMLARFRPDLSYNPGVNIGEMRYFQIVTFRVRPGHIREFEEMRKVVNEAHEKAKVDEHYAVFQASAGVPVGTYLLIIPLKSLKDLDTDPHTAAYRDALGDDNREKNERMTREGVISTEVNILALSPRMSLPSEQMEKADPAFWHPKPRPAARKKEEKAPAAKQ